MGKWRVYLDDGDICMKIAVPGTKKDAIRFVEGNGEVIAVRDITDEVPISESKVREALERASFGKTEMDLIVRCCRQNCVIDME